MKILRHPLHEKLHDILDTREVNNLERIFYNNKGIRLGDLSVKRQFHAQVMDPINTQLYFQLYYQLETDLYENT